MSTEGGLLFSLLYIYIYIYITKNHPTVDGFIIHKPQINTMTHVSTSADMSFYCWFRSSCRSVIAQMLSTSHRSGEWGCHRFCPRPEHYVYLLLLLVITLIMAVNEINRDVWTQCAAKWATTSHVFHHYTQWLWIKLWEEKKGV